ncbi:hypothetical protein GCM10022393_39230 [Aquimarina addita]|uniref:Response regulatory domain-containing protein n=1 Tax=Aquimarina addita TaxID=870485 RepID=A0ABP6UWQ0_9FLAO
MFQKILIAEDTYSTNEGLEISLKDSIPHIDTAQYCDDALLKVKKAIQDELPFELLITDLSFEESHRDRKLTSGEELIAAVKKIQPDIKIIVFSVEYRVGKIQHLLEKFQIHSYVHKSREDTKEIKKALIKVYEGNTYLSQDVEKLLHNSDNIEDIEEVDLYILQLLSQGIPQKDIPEQLRKNSFPNYRLRSVQLRINKLKELFEANSPAHLIAITKDRGLI